MTSTTCTPAEDCATKMMSVSTSVRVPRPGGLQRPSRPIQRETCTTDHPKNGTTSQQTLSTNTHTFSGSGFWRARAADKGATSSRARDQSAAADRFAASPARFEEGACCSSAEEDDVPGLPLFLPEVVFLSNSSNTAEIATECFSAALCGDSRDFTGRLVCRGPLDGENAGFSAVMRGRLYEVEVEDMIAASRSRTESTKKLVPTDIFFRGGKFRMHKHGLQFSR